MTLFHSILAATDFSAGAHHAVQRAALLAAEHGAPLELLHVMSGPSLKSLRELFQLASNAEEKLIEDAQKMLDALADEVGPIAKTPVGASVRVGSVMDEILAESRKKNLLVLGAKGLSPLKDMLLGTTAERLLHKCRHPVLVTKRPCKQPYRRVLVPVDFSPHSAAALRIALDIAPDAEITLIHAFEAFFEGKLWLAGVGDEEIHRYRVQARQQALANIDALIEESGADIARVYRIVEQGAPSPTILAREAELDADLIVIGKHGQSVAEELLLGSVTRHILADSRCDVLVMQGRSATPS